MIEKSGLFNFRNIATLVGIFFIALIIQGATWKEFGMTDSRMWGSQAKYVLSSDPRQFNFAEAYGHPGGPIIEGTIIIHKLFPWLPYDQSVLVFITIFNSLIITAICALCYLLRKDKFWVAAVLGVLSLNRLYEYATPPSAVAPLLLVFLCLLTLYAYEHKTEIRPSMLVLWGVVGGLLFATRADTGGLSGAVFLIFLLATKSINWGKLWLPLGAAAASFVVADPFMWFMPIQHLSDLVHKFTFHYVDFVPSHLTFMNIFHVSSLSLLCIFFAIIFLFPSKKIVSPLPRTFVLTNIFLTVILYIVVLTADFQSIRYLLPVLFIWEIFLPLYIFSLVDKIRLSFLKTEEQHVRSKEILKVFFIGILVCYHLVFIVQLILINIEYGLI